MIKEAIDLFVPSTVVYFAVTGLLNLEYRYLKEAF